MLRRTRSGWIPLVVPAAASCMMAVAGLWPSAAEGQAGRLARPVPEWGVNAAIESDLLRSRASRNAKATARLGAPTPATNTSDRESKKLRVLLVGNSYTKFHLLHMLIEKLADAAGGPRVQVDVEARGGYSLRLHWKSRAALSKIKNGRYSHVVLQGHSLSAIDHPDELAEDAERFSAAISAAGSRTVLFETWARKPGTSLYKKHQRVHSFDDMVTRIDTAYSGAARRLHVGLAPVGGAFQRAWRTNPTVPLWGSDGSHPTLAGSYMAACVLYGAITGRDPRHATWEPYGIDPRLAETIRSVAHASLSEAPTVVPAREPLVPAEAVAARVEAKPVEGAQVTAQVAGQVADSIAEMMGRAPGQLEAPDTTPSNDVEAPAESAAPGPEVVPASPNGDVPAMLLRDVDVQPENAAFVGGSAKSDTRADPRFMTF